jgi:multidrug efflux pump subunit AcrB
MAGQSLLIVKFYVGEDFESAIVRLNQRLATNFDRIPPGVSKPIVKPHSIDDVPILALTFHGGGYDHSILQRLAVQVDYVIKTIANVAETKIIGSTRHQVQIEFDLLLLAARNLTPEQLIPALQHANKQKYTGQLEALNLQLLLQTGQFLIFAAEIGRVVVGVYDVYLVYLADVGQITDGPQEPDTYVLYGEARQSEEAAVTLSVAKRPGSMIHADIKVSVTRNYGETAAEKSNELLLHIGIAVFGVALLTFFFLGFREALVVLLAIPTRGRELIIAYNLRLLREKLTSY